MTVNNCIKYTNIGHIYPPSDAGRCQSIHDIERLINSGEYGSVIFSDGDRDIQSWIASVPDAERLFAMIEGGLPESSIPYGATKVMLLIRMGSTTSARHLEKRRAEGYVWKRACRSTT